MESKIKSDDPKYFYLVVLITVAIAGGIIWQLFFTEPLTGSPDPRLERIPDVGFMMLDSRLFREMDPFIRGDRYLLPWDLTKTTDPFRPPRVPLSQEMREWWSIFNIVLDIEEDSWIGVFPDMISGEEDPTLVLLDGRWYEFNLTAIEDDCDFQIFNEDNDSIILYEVERDGRLLYRAMIEEGLIGYRCGQDEETAGEITVLSTEDYDSEDLFVEGTSQTLIETGLALSDLLVEIEYSEDYIDGQTIGEYRDAYSRMENRLETLNSQYGGADEEEGLSPEEESEIRDGAREIKAEAEQRRDNLVEQREVLQEEE